MNILKFKGISSVFGVAMLLIVAILMFMSMIATVDATSVANVKVIEDNCKIGVEKSTVADSQGEVEKKFKKVKTYTLTFNANRGKIGTKSKKLATKKSYGTLPKPTRSGYTFEGWFTKKSGGKKVSKTTKMVAKNTVIYAQWKKNRVLNANEKALVGEYYYESVGGGFYTTLSTAVYSNYKIDYQKWNDKPSGAILHCFNVDGTYSRLECYDYKIGSLRVSRALYSYANWAVTSKGTIQFTNFKQTKNDLLNPSNSYEDKNFGSNKDYYILTTKDGKQGVYVESSPINKDSSYTFYEKMK